jgi:alanine racemase
MNFHSIQGVIDTMPKVIKPAGRPTVAEIDLGALAYNYRQIRRVTPKETKILGVVKADAYGHGALPVSQKLEELGVEYLGVAMSDEGVQLRKGGIKTPVLLLGGVYKEDLEWVLQYKLTPVVFQKESLQLLHRAARRERKKVRVHLKVDTGMGRLGVPLRLWPAFLDDLRHFPGLEVEGILSHYSMADETDAPYTEGQWKAFQEAVAIAESKGIHARYKHISNSAGLTAFPSWSGNLVRPGIILYGSYPSPSFRDLIQLRPVMRVKTRIGLLKRVPAGEKISYGGTYVTRKQSLIATLPIGYADGYNRRLSNQGQVLVRGRRAPVVGRVCMDYIIADVSDIPGVALGDEVVLMGRQGREEISAEEIGEKIGTISYEVLCLVGRRVPRVYK